MFVIGLSMLFIKLRNVYMFVVFFISFYGIVNKVSNVVIKLLCLKLIYFGRVFVIL